MSSCAACEGPLTVRGADMGHGSRGGADFRLTCAVAFVLATPPMTASAPSSFIPSELVVFEVGPQRLGLASASVREILQAVAITPLPGAPTGVEGVIDLRGTIVPVFDLRARIALPPRPLRITDHLLVCDAGACGVVIIRADRITQIRAIADTPELPQVATAADPLVRGLARLPDGIVVICDLSAFLTEPDLETLARAMTALATPPPS